MKTVYFLFATLFIFSTFTLGCSSDSSTGKPTPACDGDDCGSGNTDDSLCTSVKSSSYLKSNSNQKVAYQFVTELCEGSLLSKLRQAPYKGNGTPLIHTLESKQFDDKYTYSKVGGSMYSPLSPSKHYKMLRMQSLESEAFEKKYKTDANLTYKLESKGTSSGNTVADYSYDNHKDYAGETFTIMYYAKTYFIPIVEGSTYIVTNRLNENKKDEGTVETMNGIIIIHKNTSIDKTEIIAISSQKAGNKGNHKNALQASKEFLEDDMKRGYENAQDFDD